LTAYRQVGCIEPRLSRLFFCARGSRDDKLSTMISDEHLLASVPDYISVGGLLKASPAEEGGERLLYIEASNEDVDHQNEVVLQKALAESADYYLRHGNVDLSHYTLIGPKAGIANFLEYEIGKPVEVRVD